jgi:hypothetical protein
MDDAPSGLRLEFQLTEAVWEGCEVGISGVIGQVTGRIRQEFQEFWRLVSPTLSHRPSGAYNTVIGNGVPSKSSKEASHV